MIPTAKIHQGRNVKRLREMLGIKQEVIALALDMTQQNMSKLEQKEEIEEELLQQIAQELKVPVEAIKNMNEEATYNYINTFNDHAISNVTNPHNCTFNPIDKIVELYNEKNELYERMLKEKDRVIELLQEIVKDKK